MTTRLVCTNLVFSLAKLLALACHGIRLPTRSESILGCSTAPSVGRTVVSQTSMAHPFSIGVICKF
ncbi:hypothetical protein [Shewanella xiamenensis]|uniref:hypothetical protein n=1 Tax=Shewanella xiamenensis TaxID=332186 RepID=UPI0018659B46|nr:hypothetical protein [Shewanella xiamenensis]